MVVQELSEFFLRIELPKSSVVHAHRAGTFRERRSRWFGRGGLRLICGTLRPMPGRSLRDNSIPLFEQTQALFSVGEPRLRIREPAENTVRVHVEIVEGHRVVCSVI
jgi:hypothetical protein